MCKMQSLQLNNLKHNRHENPIPFRMPCRDCRRRHKTDDKCRIRSQSTLYEAAWTPTSFVGMSCPSRGFCGNAISTRDINCIRAILGSTNAQDMATRHAGIAQNAMQTVLWQYFMDVHDAMGGRSRMGIAFRPVKDGGRANLPFGVKAVTATAAARQAAARA